MANKAYYNKIYNFIIQAYYTIIGFEYPSIWEVLEELVDQTCESLGTLFLPSHLMAFLNVSEYKPMIHTHTMTEDTWVFFQGRCWTLKGYQ